MKLVHAQIYGAVASLMLVGALLWGLSVKKSHKALKKAYAELETHAENAKQGAPKRASVVKLAGDQGVSQDGANRRIKQLELQNRQLITDAELLATRIAEHKCAAPGRAGTPLTAPPLAGRHPMDSPSGPPPIIAPPPAPRPEPWGATTDSEVDRLAAAVGMSDQQVELSREIMREAQNDFERELRKVQEDAKDIADFDAVADRVFQRTKQRMMQILDSAQREKMLKFLGDEMGEGTWNTPGFDEGD